MFVWTDMLLAVLVGIILSKIWNMLLYTGYAMIILQDLQKDAVKLLLSTSQTIYEIEALKLIELSKQDRPEKEIEFEKEMMEKNSIILKKAVISNFISNWPRRYRNILEFYDWPSAMEYIDKLIKEERNNKRR